MSMQYSRVPLWQLTVRYITHWGLHVSHRYAFRAPLTVSGHCKPLHACSRMLLWLIEVRCLSGSYCLRWDSHVFISTLALPSSSCLSPIFHPSYTYSLVLHSVSTTLHYVRFSLLHYVADIPKVIYLTPLRLHFTSLRFTYSHYLHIHYLLLVSLVSYFPVSLVTIRFPPSMECSSYLSLLLTWLFIVLRNNHLVMARLPLLVWFQ